MRPCPHCIVCRALSRLYGALVHLRQTLYRRGWLQTLYADVPLIVIGNVSAGGTGKTPVCLRIITELQAQGWRPALISRGYGRKTKGVVALHAASRAEEVGDEALLVYQKCGVPVVVGENRHKAAQTVRELNPQCNIIVSDDGLQHYALGRTIEVIVHDERTQVGAPLLPAGWLREPWPRRRVFDCPEIILPSPKRALAIPESVRQAHAQGLSFAAFAAIAKPEAFFQALRDAGLSLSHTLALPDHAPLQSNATWEKWLHSLPSATPVLCTEKDFVKLSATTPEASSAKPLHSQDLSRITAIPLAITLPPDFLSTLWEVLGPTPAASSL